uniref:Enhancer of polycomb homolog 1 n=1 Tax=Oryctolagus cuniculus TaxID=9986 RepID=A0A5F9DC37_RABIT
MSKLSFRARALDASKPLPVFRCEDLPDLHEYASINRAVPQMPTGMEKEEESVQPSEQGQCLDSSRSPGSADFLGAVILRGDRQPLQCGSCAL